MRDGYYLSSYLTPPGLHRLAMVSYRHDNNISLWHRRGSEIRLLGHWEFERLSGLKHHRTPFLTMEDLRSFVNGLLAGFGLSLDDMTEVWGTPGLATTNDYHFVEEYPELSFHSIAHLYSAMLLDGETFFEGDILGLAVDGGPDRLLDQRYKRYWFTGAVSRRGVVETFPVASPGLLYSTAKDRFKMREGTLMALATATRAAGRCDRESILRTYDFTGLAALEGAPLAFEEIAAQVRETAGTDPDFTEEESFVSAVMKEIQAISVMAMERNIETALERYDLDPAQTHLALAGGYALNCPTNSHLMAKYGFRGLLAPPCVDDGGQAIGIGLAAFHKKTGGERFTFRFPGAYLGRQDDDLDGALAEFGEYVADVSDLDHDRAVRDILAEPIAWFHGRSEIGPRALGNRSLLGDPTSREAKDALNRFKLREWWRPVAPVVLEDQLEEWFEDSRPSPYMLETFTIREKRRGQIQAVAHLDYSARVQSLNAGQNPALHALLTAFHRYTGVPMLCNTSLNDKGEPIIDTIRETINFCLRRRIGVAYLNGRRVAFHNFDSYPAKGPYPRMRLPFTSIPASRAEAVHAELNPYRLPDLYLHVLYLDLALSGKFDLRTEEGAAEAFKAVNSRLRADPSLWRAAERSMRRAEHRFTTFGPDALLNLELGAVRQITGA
ncbi:carbamoyltransferase C-terminal domain-containing protein [Streptosporangium sp. NPDC023615]|uniref:carbamoyltransferase C-terminal domain-containing protein n=1 Tax=Streptosporangium sp. NPDC023615 TaxID=3154794 RepID=UPI003420EE3E